MRIAALADIHGNARALDAVLDDLASHAPDLVVNLGDCLSGPLDPAGTAERLIDLNLPTVRGNHDRQVVTIPLDQQGRSDTFASQRITDRHRDWLRGFPEQLLVADDVLLCHGTPASDTEYLIEDIDAGRLRLADERTILGRLGTLSRGVKVVLCGHSHSPNAVRVGQCLVVNPGSVGLPAYNTDEPTPHISQSGSPFARYALLDKRRAGWQSTFVTVRYDWDAASADAAAAGFADWSVALKSGYARQ